MTVTTTAVIDAAEKEVAVKVGWLESNMSNTRHEGEEAVSAAPSGGSGCAPNSPGHILGWKRFLFRKGTDEDVTTESLGYPCEIRPVCRISDSRNPKSLTI